MIGTRLGHYEITERIGEGGMGVVWKATDTTLGRSVAIKVLPELLARDPERLARLEREARLLAALSHPNIASIYGLHEEGGVRFLAMELAAGENLAARMARGPLAIDEALAIALRIAEALEHAHENGIVHRDLKPANVVIGEDGAVKVLDFGLAKAFETEQASGSSPSLTQSPTITAGMTAANVVLGTAAYMSPEQARGQAADKRADIWSFGVVLYEMLTGARMFEGETVSDVLAAVLRADFEWRRLPDTLPPRVRMLLERCLERDRRARLRDIGEARIVLAAQVAGAPDPYRATGAAGAGAGTAAASGAPGSRWVLAGAIAGAAAVALTAGLLLGRGPGRGAAGGPSQAPYRMFTLRAGPAPELPQISPDGRRVAWMEADTLLVQELDSIEPRRIPMPARARPRDLFWSPDGAELGYITGSSVRAIDMRTREERLICEAGGAFTSGAGASWGDDGMIALSRAENDGLLQVPAGGGDPRTIAPADSVISDYHAPHALPGGRGILFVAHLEDGPFDNIQVFDGRRSRELLKVENHSLYRPVYSRTGHILYYRSAPNAGLWAVPFSLEKLATTGEPFIVSPDASAPSVANDGTLVYLSGQSEAEADLVVTGADGVVRANLMRLVAPYSVFPAFSPDGRRVVVDQANEEGSDVWILDLDRGTRTRLTFAEGVESLPSWTPDGSSILYQALPRSGSNWSILMQPADGSGEPDTLVRGGVMASVTADGGRLLYTALPEMKLEVRPLAGGDVTASGIGGIAKAVVSPDGRFVAYVSVESGRNEVYLRRFPSFSGKWQVSVQGGDWPVWSARSDRLYFAADDDVMVVDVAAGDSPGLGTPRRLFTRPRLSQRGMAGWSAKFGMNADGTAFVFGIDVEARAATRSLVLNQNWFAPFAARAQR